MFSTATEKTYAGHLKTKGVVSSLDGRLGLGLLDINSASTPTYIKIKTKIPFVSGNADFTISIKGYSYSNGATCDLSISWHYYNNTFWNPTCDSNGSWTPSAVYLDVSGGLVTIVLTSPGYWPKLYVESGYSSYYKDNYWHDWSWVDEGPSSAEQVNVPISASTVEMLQATLTTTAASTIVSNNGGTAFVAPEFQSNTDILTVSNNKILVKKPGFVFVSLNQDVIASGAETAYVAMDIRRVRGGAAAVMNEQLCANQGSGVWTCLHASSSFPVEANDIIDFTIGTGADITALDSGTWSAYNVIWRAGQ